MQTGLWYKSEVVKKIIKSNACLIRPILQRVENCLKISLQANNDKRISKNTLLPKALYDGGIALYEPSYIECVLELI